VYPMRPVVAALAATTALLVAGCGDGSTSGSGSPATSSPTSSPSASPTGNGIAGLSAEAILAKAKAALVGADSVRIKGTGGTGTERFDIDMSYVGANSTGSLSVAGQKVDLRKLGQTVYLRGSREFWTGIGGTGAAELLSGKWLKAPITNKKWAQLAELTDLSKAADGILEPDGPVTKGQPKAIDGKQAITLKSGTGAEEGALYIATEGEPYPLRIESTKDKGKVDFTGYGEPVKVEAPPSDLVVDVTKLPGA
jgi:hypothetical protein